MCTYLLFTFRPLLYIIRVTNAWNDQTKPGCHFYNIFYPLNSLRHDHDFIMIYISCGKTFSLVPISRSSVYVNVKYQGYIFQQEDHDGPISLT